MKSVSFQANLEISRELMYQNKTSYLHTSIISDMAVTVQHKVKKELSS